MSDHIDPKTLTPEEIKAAIIEHCNQLGSSMYFVMDELEWTERDPAGLVVFKDGMTGKLRAYHRRKRH